MQASWRHSEKRASRWRLVSPLWVGVSLLAAACSGSGGSPDGGASTSGTAGATSTGTVGGATGGTTGSGSSTGGTGGTSGGADGGDAGLPPQLGDPCNAQAAPDTCAQYGLICDQNSSECRWPAEFETCSIEVGCADSTLRCVSFKGASGTEYQVCFHPCATTDECPTLFSQCDVSGALAGYCDLARCGPAIDAGSLFGACQIEGANDGLCIPLSSPGLGACFETGPVAAGGVCSTSRLDGGASMFCDSATTCAGFSTSGTSVGQFCQPVCSTNASIPGPTCQQGDVCLDLGGGLQFGGCLQDCTGGAPCPSGTTCANLQSSGMQLTVCVP